MKWEGKSDDGLYEILLKPENQHVFRLLDSKTKRNIESEMNRKYQNKNTGILFNKE